MTDNWVEVTKDAIYSLLSTTHKLNLPEPPVPRLLCTNDPPTDAEIVLIRAAITDAIAEAARFRRKLFKWQRDTRRNNSIKGMATVIQARIESADTFIHKHEGLLSLSRCIPPEVLQEIFFWANGDPYFDNSRQIVMSWRLSQVCRTWRKISFSTSALWTRLPIIIIDRPYAQTPYFLELLTEVLKRSREGPINLHIYAQNRMEAHPALDFLVRHSERWRVLTLITSTTSLFLLRGIRGRLPLLESLFAEINGTSPPFGDYCDFFGIAPRLRHVNLMCNAANYPILPVSQLTTYKDCLLDDYHTIYRSLLHLVIMEATSLERLTIMNLEHSIVIPFITLPRLIELHIHFDLARHHEFLEKLTLPAIEDISIMSPPCTLLPTLTSLILRSHSTCPLRRLTLNNVLQGDLTTLLQLTPLLECLSIAMPSLNDLRNLIFTPSNAALVPFLEKCFFRISDRNHDVIYASEFSHVFNAFASSRCEEFPPGGSRPRRSPLELVIDCGSPSHNCDCDYGRVMRQMFSQLAPSSTSRPNCLFLAFMERFNIAIYGALFSPPVINNILLDIEHAQVTDIRDVYVREFRLFSP